MMANDPDSPTALIGDVARETGLSKDTLRIWERRYGFPSPTRNHNDERVYGSEQITRLQIIRRLLDSGLRPGRIVGLPLEQLSAFRPSGKPAPAGSPEVAGPLQLLELVKSQHSGALQHRLSQLLMELGLRRFIREVVAPLNSLVGEAWLTGAIDIFQEHLYTNQIQGLLQHALGTLPASFQPPQVLLTTLPGEEHQLGLLMAQAFFAMEGSHCLPLGTQTPPAQIAKAVAAHEIDIVGLSCTGAVSPRLTHSQLSLVREVLDRRVEVWVGGSIGPPDRLKVTGVRYVTDLAEIRPLLAQWRAQSRMA